jgi:hypothetical protein
MNYQRIYTQLIERAQGRILEGYTEKHHILPKCLGGSNDKENLVELTAREHFLCHMLLCEIYPKENKLKYALWCMVNGKHKSINNGFIPSSRLYEIARLNFIEAHTGFKFTDEMRSRTGRKLGFPHSQKSKDKIRKSKLGRPVTWGDKISKSKIGISREITWGDKISKCKTGKSYNTRHVEQICPQTNQTINSFISVNEAKKITGAKSIASVLCGDCKTSGGFIWRYKE